MPVGTPELDKILVVDDDDATREAIAETLREAGFQVCPIGDASMPIAGIVAGFQPDLVLLDVNLGVRDGFDVFRDLRQLEEARDVPVIFMSGSALGETSVVRALKGGACDFLRRPFGNHELIARVGVALRNRRAQLELHRLGTTDALTGLFNRRAFFDALERERRRAQRNRSSLSIVAIDIDRFKLVNDTYGHPAGDRVLQGVGRVLQNHCRVTDIVGRLGGEEFAAILPGTEPAGAIGLAEKLRMAIAGLQVEISSRVVLQITASFGLATANGVRLLTADDSLGLLARADAALYDAKRAGRDRVELAPAAV